MKLTVLAATLVMGLGTISAANAMPMEKVNVPGSSDVVKVGFACGPGWHMNRYGDCVRNRRPPPRYWGPPRFHRPPPPPPRWGWHHHGPRHHWPRP